jgi:hypothetical protein
MKITYEDAGKQDTQHEITYSDVTDLLDKFKEQYRNVFIFQIDGQLFFYRTLGRSEFKKILDSDQLDDMAKEEVICGLCTLYPENYDFEDCEAGIPTSLSKAIIKNSYLDGVDSRSVILTYYRQEMFDLDNQITCIINEAFPQFDIEEIESWDIEKTTKYLSRAEWKLHNLRGMQFYDPETTESFYQKQEEKQQPRTRQVKTEEIGNDPEPQKTETLEERQERLNKRGTKREKLTPEKLAEMKAKFPEINWEADSVLQDGIGALKDNVDVLAPALRPGW